MGRRTRRLLLLTALVAAASVPTAFAGAAPSAGGPEAAAAPSPAATDPATTPDTAPVTVRRPPPGALIAKVRPGASIALHDRPGGAVAVRLGPSTEFGTRQTLGVVRERGRWLGVTTAQLPNGQLGWIDRRDGAVRLSRTRWSLHADISRREVLLRRGDRVVRRLSVAVGAPGSPTPTGRFAVTDKLAGASYSAYYGCCILALSATQPSTPAGWQGGNRIALHGTNSPGTIGSAASAGCLRAADEDLTVLMDLVPVGTPVTIRP